MADLKQNTDTVTDFSAGILTCTMVQFFNDFQRVIKNTIVLMSVDIDDRTDTAGIMFHFCFV